MKAAAHAAKTVFPFRKVPFPKKLRQGRSAEKTARPVFRREKYTLKRTYAPHLCAVPLHCAFARHACTVVPLPPNSRFPKSKVYTKAAARKKRQLRANTAPWKDAVFTESTHADISPAERDFRKLRTPHSRGGSRADRFPPSALHSEGRGPSHSEVISRSACAKTPSESQRFPHVPSRWYVPHDRSFPASASDSNTLPPRRQGPLPASSAHA